MAGLRKDCLTWVVLATGPSMNQGVADYVRGKCCVVAVSNAYTLAPWADALVSNDRRWWDENPEAYNFKGLKFSGHTLRFNVQGFNKHNPLGRNSGLMGMCVARELGAKRLLLCGFDMHGSHFFGEHPAPLKNSTEKIFANHIKQFDGFSGCDVVNCTEGSRLTRFPFRKLEESI